MATKLVELSKRIRDMTAEQESMKTRMKQIMAENEQLKERMLSPKSEPNLDPQEEGVVYLYEHLQIFSMVLTMKC